VIFVMLTTAFNSCQFNWKFYISLPCLEKLFLFFIIILIFILLYLLKSIFIS